jgi:hypothetical protein
VEGERVADAKLEPPPPARAAWPFVLGAVPGAVMGWVSYCILANARHWYLLAAWVAITCLWTAYFPTLRTRAAFLIGSVLGFLVALGSLVLLVAMMLNWSVPG